MVAVDTALGAPLLDRGPPPAGGDHNTRSVARARLRRDVAVHSIPDLRVVGGSAADGPLQRVNSGGRSGNPASSRYDDGIAVRREWGSLTLPLYEAGRAGHYSRLLTLAPG